MATVKDIAKKAGVSSATVSRVFSHHPAIREPVRQKVLAVARAAGYHPRISDKQKNVVIVTPYNSVFPVQSCVDMLLMALTQCLPVRGFRVEILPVNNLERLKSIQFCGTIAIGCEADDFPGWGNQFTFPLVLLDRPLKTRGPELYCVRSDEAQGMELAISHLHEAGCRRIGVIVHGMPDSGNALVRHKAIFDSFRKFGLPEERSLVHYSGFGNDKYMELIAKLLKHRIDALFCPGGSAGIVGMYVLNLLGKHVPDDISFIASEQTFFSQYAVPPQTTITQQYDKLAEAAADIITARIDGRHPPVETILPYTLLDRESVASSNME